jgi:alkylhydroperoxidase family enzyme
MQYEYCISLNGKILKMMGITSDDQLAAVMADPQQAPMEEKEKALLALVIKACAKPETVQEADVQALRDLGWQDSDILDAISHGLMMVQGGILAKAVGLPEGAAC